jgi:large subunit ribosomal protein L23
MDRIALKPRLSEKAYGLSEKLNTYVFDVPKSANKHAIAEAIAEQFKVTVTNVRVASIAARNKRVYKKRGRAVKATTSTLRKAYVSLKEGDKLPIFNSVEEAAKPAKESK